MTIDRTLFVLLSRATSHPVHHQLHENGKSHDRTALPAGPNLGPDE